MGTTIRMNEMVDELEQILLKMPTVEELSDTIGNTYDGIHTKKAV